MKVEKEILIRNKLGLHARPAAQLVQLANRFTADIFLYKGRDQVNAKSIMGVLMLAAAQGSTIRVIAEGEDAGQAVSEIEELIADRFGEE